jgi:hypothetical protein
MPRIPASMVRRRNKAVIVVVAKEVFSFESRL